MALPSEFDGLLQPAPRRSSWRKWLGLGVVIATWVALAAWLALPSFRDADADRRIVPRRDDGIVVEWSPLGQRPRPGVTVVPKALLSFPYAYPPDNSGVGPCIDPLFSIENMPPLGHVYKDGEALTVPIHYKAPGCSSAVIAYLGRHIEGSLRYNLLCDSGLIDCEDIRSWFFTDAVELSGDEGVLRLQGNALLAAAVTVDSIPNLDGFVLCAVTVSVGKSLGNANHSSQTIRLGCPFDEPP